MKNCRSVVKHSNPQSFQNAFSCILRISPSSSILCPKILVKELLQSTFCDQTLYITSVYRVLSHVTKVALLNNFRNESDSAFPAHGSGPLNHLDIE